MCFLSLMLCIVLIQLMSITFSAIFDFWCQLRIAVFLPQCHSYSKFLLLPLDILQAYCKFAVMK